LCAGLGLAQQREHGGFELPVGRGWPKVASAPSRSRAGATVMPSSYRSMTRGSM
jgi:hypothetical protein